MKKIPFVSNYVLILVSSVTILAFTLGAILTEGEPAFAQTSQTRRVNVPYFGGEDVRFNETAIFWFGRITPSENYTDVRVGYNDSELYFRVAVFDRLLWYDQTPELSDLTGWDAITLYLDVDPNGSNAIDDGTYSFVGQLDWWEPRDTYQASYEGDGSGFVPYDSEFTTVTGWRGNAPNDNIDDRGRVLTYHIPFSAFGLSGPPAQETVWGLALSTHDRDASSGSMLPTKSWPESMGSSSPASWGELVFGLPSYDVPDATSPITMTIRQGLDGAVVPDAHVGGGTICGDDVHFWNEWGDTNRANTGLVNIQNQGDVADWPCYSKYYLTFPLDMLPENKVIISAWLTLHQNGHSGGGPWGEAQPSLIQVLRIEEAWDELTLTWNNAPLAAENYASLWVDPVPFTDWPGTPFMWEVGYGVAQAYSAGEPLRLVLYESDGAYHSGKYFVTSDTGDWNAEGRPTLEIQLGDPIPTTTFTDVPEDYWAYDYIETLYQLGYIAGCATNPLRYCPDRILSRAESSVFILRGNYGSIQDPPHPPPVSPTFADVDPGYWGYGWIESLWMDGYTAGCTTNPLAYCPTREHTRAEGSVFFLRTKNGIDFQPPPAQDIFIDVSTTDWYADWVEAAYNEGLLPACSTDPLAFCPQDQLDRAWAAYMMVQAKGLPLP